MDGTVWKYTSPSEREPVAEGLALPEGLALEADGSLLVVETGIGQLSRIDPATGEVTAVAEGLALGAPGPVGMPPTWIFSGVAVGAEGTIYVTGEIGSVVYRIEARP
jgi:sugar lactone lactonase YvrE